MHHGPAYVVYDGCCAMCSWSAGLIARYDRKKIFTAVPSRSEEGQRILGSAGMEGATPDTILLIEEGRSYTRSGAILQIMRRLSFPWPLAGMILGLLPTVMLDYGYKVVAGNRKRSC